MIQLAAEGQGKREPLNGGKEWVIRLPLVAASEEQSKAVRHVLGSEDFVISFKGPAGAGKTELMTEVDAGKCKRLLKSGFRCEEPPQFLDMWNTR